MKNPDVDRGYAWVVLACCGIIYLIIAGSVKSFGVLYTELLDYYEAGAGNTAWISSVCLFLFMGLGPFSNFVGERFTYRVVMIVGSCIVLIGYTASAFVNSVESLYLTYGVVTGIGYGLIFAPCTTIISFYFEERRSLANGLMVSFSGIGNLIFPYLYRYLIDSYGLHGALLIIGAVLFHACAASLFLRQPPQLLKNRKLTDEEIELTSEKKTDTSSGCVYEASRRIFKIDLFRIPKYTILLLAIIFQVGNYAGIIVALPGQVRSLKLGKDTIVLSVSLLGAAEMVSRAFLGWFGDLNILKRSTLFMICAFVSAVIAFVIPFLPYKSALLIYSVLVGTFSGSFWSLMGVLIVDCVGLDNFSPAFGLLSMFCAIAICISQPITGWLEDVTGNWEMSFYFVGLCSAICFLLCLFDTVIERLWCCHKESVNIQEEVVKIEITENVTENNVLLESN